MSRGIEVIKKMRESEVSKTELQSIFANNPRVIFMGETEHRSGPQHHCETAMLPKMAANGFTILALEGIAPSQDSDLRGLGLRYQQTRDGSEISRFAYENWMETAGDSENQANKIRMAFDLRMEVVGVDMDQKELTERIPKDSWEDEFADPAEREKVRRIISGEEKMDVQRILAEEGMQGIINMTGLMEKISKALAAVGEKKSRFLDEVIVKERDEVMATNIDALLMREGKPKVVVSLGETHAQDRKSSTRDLTTEKYETSTVILVEPEEGGDVVEPGLYQTGGSEWVNVIF
jgi:hypothetical protein